MGGYQGGGSVSTRGEDTAYSMGEGQPRMVNKTTSGPGGKPIKKVSRQTYYVCNEDNIEGSLRQSQMSFTDARRTTIPAEEDTMDGDKFPVNFSLTT